MLRPYQSAAVEDIHTAWQQYRRVCFVLPTGGGKTEISAEIIERAATRRQRVIFGVHRQELVDQTSRTLSRRGIQHGIIAADTPDNPRALIQVASTFTLARRLNRFARPDIYIQDECHHVLPDNTWGKVFEWLPPATRILGVTATPERLDGRGLRDSFDHMLIGPSTQELIDAGYLADPILFAPPTPINLDGIHIRGGDYAREEIELEVSKPAITGCAVESYQKYVGPECRAIAFCTSVAHARSVAEQFNAQNIPAGAVDGSQTKPLRNQILSDFATGRIQVLAAADLISEGFDVPAASAAILLRPTKSLALYLQQVGRALRPAPGKTHAIILDHVANYREHGHPTDEHHWTLDAPRRKRRSEKLIALRQCPNCFMVDGPRASCRYCGQEFTARTPQIDHNAGELVAIDKQTARAAAAARIKERLKQCKEYEDFVRLGQEEGYKPGWADIQWRLRRRWKPTIETFTA